MSSFSDQIKNTSTGCVIRLYEITRQYSIMSLLRIEESVGLAPMAHGQGLLGSRDTQSTEPAKLAPEGTTQTQTFKKFPSYTGSIADIKQGASGNISQVQDATDVKKKRKKKANTIKHHQDERTTESIQNERDKKRQIHLNNIQRHPSTTANVINRTTTRCQAHGQCMHIPYSRGAAMTRNPQQQHMNRNGEHWRGGSNLPSQGYEHRHMEFYPNGQDNEMFSFNGRVMQDLRGPREGFY